MKTKTSISNISPRFSLRLAPALVVAALTAICPFQTGAATVALSFTDSGNRFTGSNNNTFGWAFTLSSPILLTDLGVFDSFGTGFVQSHPVTVWTSTGTQEAQTTIPAGTSAPITDGFRYESITPVLLLPGSYTIGVFNQAGTGTGQYDPLALLATTITTAPGIAYNGSRSGPGNQFPSGDQFVESNSYFGPNFEFSAAVPEVPTWVVPALAALAIGIHFFRRRFAS